MKQFLSIIFSLFVFSAIAQNNIGIGTTTPNASALLDVSSTSKGLLIPRMTAAQRLAINPANSARALMLFDTDSSAFFFWTGTVWSKLGAGGGSGASQWVSNGSNIYNSNSGNVGIGTNFPEYPLSFVNQPGDKISLFLDVNNGNYYGLGIGNSTMQLITPNNNADVVFGIGRSNNFTENLRIKGNGNVGIGESSPSAKLSINGNIKIADGTQGVNKVLTSDANGLASWQVLPATSNSWTVDGNNLYNNYSTFVGIGNSNPQFRLDLSGRMRLRGGSDNNNSAGFWLGGTGTDSATNKMFMGMSTDSSAGFYSDQNLTGWFLVADGRNGRVGIRNRFPKFPLSFDDAGGDKVSLLQDGNGNYYGMGIGNASMQLMTPHSTSDIIFGYGLSAAFTENMRIKGNGLVGIKNPTPNFPLSFQDISGDKISLFRDLNSNYYGLGVGNSLMQLMTPHSTSDIVFGYGKSAAFTENMRIKGNGNVGIGITDPAYKLDVGARMRIRATPGFTAGHWLNNGANTASPAFIGMFADDQVGFYGTGTGWSFLMNTQTGAISFGGVAGQPGQVLTSNGNAGAPAWQSAGGSKLYFAAQPSAPSDIVEFSNTEVDIPGAVANFALTTSSRVKFHFRSDAFARSCFACGDKKVVLRLMQNISGGTTEINKVTTIIPNSEILSIVSGPVILDLAAGNYSFKLTLNGGSTGSSISAGGQLGFLSWEIFQQ